MLLAESLYSSRVGFFTVGLSIIRELALLYYSVFRKRFPGIQQLLLNPLKLDLRIFNVRDLFIYYLKCNLGIG